MGNYVEDFHNLRTNGNNIHNQYLNLELEKIKKEYEQENGASVINSVFESMKDKTNLEHIFMNIVKKHIVINNGNGYLFEVDENMFTHSSENMFKDILINSTHKYFVLDSNVLSRVEEKYTNVDKIAYELLDENYMTKFTEIYPLAKIMDKKSYYVLLKI